MAAFDEERIDHNYTEHLASVSQTSPVTATEDIFNAQGILLVRKGAVLDQKAANKIVQFKLLNPLTESIALESNIDGRSLYDIILKNIYMDKGCAAYHESINIKDELRQLCLLYGTYPTLVQKLTVLSVQLPLAFLGATVSAYVGLSIAIKLKLSHDSQLTVFLAGLAQNIGLLHLSPALVKKSGAVSPDEKRALKVHPIIGHKVLASIPKLPKGVAQAVLNHHERTDGSGYPRGVMAKALCIESQIIAMVDSMFALYGNRCLSMGYSIKELIPVLQLNNSSHFYKVYEALIQLLRGAQLPDIRRVDDADIPVLINRMIVENKYFYLRGKLSAPLEKKILRNSPFKLINVALVISKRLHEVAYCTGLATLSCKEWLERVRDQQLVDEYMEVERAALIHAEFKYYLQEIDDNLFAALDEYPDMPESQQALIREWGGIVEGLKREYLSS